MKDVQKLVETSLLRERRNDIINNGVVITFDVFVKPYGMTPEDIEAGLVEYLMQGGYQSMTRAVMSEGKFV